MKEKLVKMLTGCKTYGEAKLLTRVAQRTGYGD